MIYLNQGIENQPAAVCSRNALLANPFYLWNMVHKLSETEYNFVPYRIPPADNSYKPMYDMFCVSIYPSQPQVLTGASACGLVNIHFIPGEYYLKIYEQTSATNLNPTLAYNLVNETLVFVVGTNQNIPITYSGRAEDEVFTIYNSDND